MMKQELKKLKLKLEDRPEGAFDHEGHRGSIFEQLVLVDEIQDPAIICRKDAILAANQAFAEFAGYSQVDLIGRDIAELTDESLWDKLMDYVQRRLARPSKVPSEFVAHAKMGKLGKKKLTIRVASVGKTKNLFLLIIRAN